MNDVKKGSPTETLDLEYCDPSSIQTIVSAIFYTETRHYLLQLRDNKPALPLPNHWALFGGNLELNESPEDCLIREINEELEYKIKKYYWYHSAIYALPKHKHKIVRKIYFVVKITSDEILSMNLREGAAMKAHSLEEILQLKNVSPWDAGVIMMHERHNTVFSYTN